jgi:dTDP-4-dehydrorhamnose 3,5-epimerase
MRLRATDINGCFVVEPEVFGDDRGLFVKTYHEDTFSHSGIRCDWRELFWSRTRRGVIRGLHFQKPPADQAKLVTCVSGRIFDVAVDLRRSSDSYGHHTAVELSAESGGALFLPRGLAHGFMALTEGATVCYAVETVYSPSLDAGIHWASCEIDWPAIDGSAPVVSARDESFPPLHSFVSPFYG